MSDIWSITISPDDVLAANLDCYVERLNDVKGLIKLYVVREFGDEGTHPHLHGTLHFDTKIILQVLIPRLKKVFGFIPKKPLLVCKPLMTLVDLENWTAYIHSEEGFVEEETWGYIEGEIKALCEAGVANKLLNNNSINVSYRFLERCIDWTKIKDRNELFAKMFELKRKGYDLTSVATNPRKLASWFYFHQNAFQPKLNVYGDHTYAIWHPNN